jgi:hypothetical protein
MTGFIRVEGGPHLGLTPVEPPLHPTIALGVNVRLERDDAPEPYAYAIYKLKRQADRFLYFQRVRSSR